jgi:hypothetical protein
MSGPGRCCRKKILLIRARKIDSRLGGNAQRLIQNRFAPIRLLRILILQSVSGYFFDSIGQNATESFCGSLHPTTAAPWNLA